MTRRSLLPSLWGRGDHDPFRDLQNEIDRVFGDFSRRLPMWRDAEEGGAMMAPRMDVRETEKALEITVELPGVKEDDVEVSLVDQTLTIRGEKKSEKKENEGNWHRTERSYGSFMRSLTLPFKADPGKVKADFRDGVLTIEAVKPPEIQAKAQKIAIGKTG